jgi:hypothetical protein
MIIMLFVYNFAVIIIIITPAIILLYCTLLSVLLIITFVLDCIAYCISCGKWKPSLRKTFGSVLNGKAEGSDDNDKYSLLKKYMSDYTYNKSLMSVMAKFMSIGTLIGLYNGVVAGIYLMNGNNYWDFYSYVFSGYNFYTLNVYQYNWDYIADYTEQKI